MKKKLQKINNKYYKEEFRKIYKIKIQNKSKKTHDNQ